MSIKDYFKEKFSKGKAARFFDREGFYFVLFLCVCIVAITAVWVSRSGVKVTNPPASIGNNNTNVTVPSKETSNQGENSNNDKLPGNEESNTSKDTTGSQNNGATVKNNGGTTSTSGTSVVNHTVSSIKLGSPFKDQVSKDSIIRDYSPNDMVWYEYFGNWKVHNGIDIKAVMGTDVLSTFSGKIIDIRDDNDGQGAMGWTIVIDHGNGYRTVYSNLDAKIAVKKNVNVAKGQKIGVIGMSSLTEKSTSEEKTGVSHLHFEVLKKQSDGSYAEVDPKSYLTIK